MNRPEPCYAVRHDHDAEVVGTVAAVIREVDGSHELGAAALAKALVNRGVTITTGCQLVGIPSKV